MPVNSAALIAATRLGFAARGEDLSAIGRDPRGWALAQLERRAPPLPGELPDSASMVVAELEFRRERKDPDARRAFNQRVRAVYLAEVEARIGAAAASDTPLLERLCHFWGNHFTVSILRPAIRGFAAAFEREAIRPHVTGRFQDMLLAAMRHPAMLLYLDNAINENLGRELLELHTLGVDGGYTQQDVEALARILTGWSVARLNEPDPGHFPFRPGVHKPGPNTLLGRSYAEAGYA